MDLPRGRLDIRPKKEWTPKTDSSVRHVPLAPALRDHLAGLKPKARSRWVIADSSGWRPASANAMGAEFQKNVIRGARLRGRVHILRHTFASWLAQASVPLYTISKLLGHSSISQTEIYAHLCPDTYETAISSLPAIPKK